MPDSPESAGALVTTAKHEIELTVRPVGTRATPVRYPDFETLSPHIHLEAVAFDSLGRPWGAGAGGVMRWDRLKPTDVSFTTWHSEHGLAGGDITHLCAAGNSVAVGHASGCVSVYREAESQWDVYDVAVGYPVHALCAGDDTIIAATDAGLFDILRGLSLPAPDEPILCAAFALSTWWVGTATGLWRIEANGSITHIEHRPNSVTHLQATPHRLWIGSEQGLAVTLDGKKINTTPISAPVAQLSAWGNALYILVTGEILRIRGDEGGSLATLPPGSSVLAAGEHGCVYDTYDQNERRLVHRSDDAVKPLRLTPNATLRNPARVFTGGIVQNDDNALWYAAGDEWKPVLSTVATGMVTAIVRDYAATQSGLAQLIDKPVLGKTLADANAPFAAVINLAEYDGVLWAIALESTPKREMYYAVWQEGWTRVARLPASLGEPLALLTADGVQVITTNGVYNLPDLACVQSFDLPLQVASDSGVRVAVSDGRRVFEANVGEISLPRGCATVTALGFAGDVLYIGTVAGLWRMTNPPQRLDARTSGLPHDTIAALHTDDGSLWVLTAGGLTKFTPA